MAILGGGCVRRVPCILYGLGQGRQRFVTPTGSPITEQSLLAVDAEEPFELVLPEMEKETAVGLGSNFASGPARTIHQDLAGCSVDQDGAKRDRIVPAVDKFALTVLVTQLAVGRDALHYRMHRKRNWDRCEDRVRLCRLRRRRFLHRQWTWRRFAIPISDRKSDAETGQTYQDPGNEEKRAGEQQRAAKAAGLRLRWGADCFSNQLKHEKCDRRRQCPQRDRCRQPTSRDSCGQKRWNDQSDDGANRCKTHASPLRSIRSAGMQAGALNAAVYRSLDAKQ